MASSAACMSLMSPQAACQQPHDVSSCSSSNSSTPPPSCWQECSQGLCRDVHAVQRDPFSSKKLYAVAGSGNLPGGVYRCKGQKWKRLFGYRWVAGRVLAVVGIAAGSVIWIMYCFRLPCMSSSVCTTASLAHDAVRHTPSRDHILIMEHPDFWSSESDLGFRVKGVVVVLVIAEGMVVGLEGLACCMAVTSAR